MLVKEFDFSNSHALRIAQQLLKSGLFRSAGGNNQLAALTERYAVALAEFIQ